MSFNLAFPKNISLYYLLLNTHNELTQFSSDSCFTIKQEKEQENNDENNDELDEVVVPFSLLISKIKSFTYHQLIDSFLFHVDTDFTKENDKNIFLKENESENII